MKKQRYELIAGKSAKFWEVSVKGSSMTTAYGRISTKGQSRVKDFMSPAAARSAAEKLIAQKVNKGYSQIGRGKTGRRAKPTKKKTLKTRAAGSARNRKVDLRKLNESAALKLAKSADTSKVDLRKLVGQFEKVDRVLAKRDDLSGTLLNKLSHSSDRMTRRNVASNPNCNTETLLRLAPQFPAEFLKNSQFDRMRVEDPACFHKMDEDILVRLLKQDSCPEGLVQYGLQLGERDQFSEAQAAVFLLAGIRRLEETYPKLKRLVSFAPAIQPKYEAIVEAVEPHVADRKSSGLGRLPFLSKRFPMLKKHAPMLQLDLAEASRVTKEDLGHGLLQVWMPNGLWGQDQKIPTSGIRVIPHHVAKSTKHLLEIPENKIVTDLIRIICDDEVEYWDSEHWQELWNEYVNGNVWNIRGDVSRYEPIQALQITGWEAAGYVLPPASDCLWGGGIPQEVAEDPIFEAMDKACDDSAFTRCCLFGISHYTVDLWVTNDEPAWRPLFAFDGPDIDPCVNEHTVFFRRRAGRFEYICILDRFT